MKKSFILLITVLVMAFAVVGCGKSSKEKEDDDKQLCEKVKSAASLAAMEISYDKDLYNKIQNVEMSMSSIKGSNEFEKIILEYLGVSSGSEVNDELESKGASEIKFKISGNSCVVWVEGTDIKVN